MSEGRDRWDDQVQGHIEFPNKDISTLSDTKGYEL